MEEGEKAFPIYLKKPGKRCHASASHAAEDPCGQAAEQTAKSLPYCPPCLLKAEEAALPEVLLTQVLIIHFM